MKNNENKKLANHISYYDERNNWLKSTDDELFKQCKCDFFKSTGKGGQKRNKTSSAVRLTHLIAGISASADDYRSQHDNRHLALKRLRFELALRCRCHENLKVDLKISKKNSQYSLLIALLCDIIVNNQLNIKESATILSLSSNQLVKILYKDNKLWQYLQFLREQAGLSRLKRP